MNQETSMETIEVMPIRQQEIETQGNEIFKAAQNMVVNTVEDKKAAASFIKAAIRTRKKKVEEEIGTKKSQAYKLWKGLSELINKLVNPLDQAEKIIKSKMNEFDDREEARLRKEAQEQAEREQKEREKKLNRIKVNIEKITARTDDIKTNIQDLTERLNDTDDADTAEMIRAEIEILEARLEGNKEKVAMKMEQADELNIPSYIAPPSLTPKATGVASSKKTVVTEVYNPQALIKAIVEGKVQVDIRKIVKKWDLTVLTNLYNAGIQLPGCKVETKRIQAIR